MNDTPEKPTAAPLPDWLATAYPGLSLERLAALPVRGADAAPWPPPPAIVELLGHTKTPLHLTQNQTVDALRHAAAMEARLSLDVLSDALRRALVDILDRQGKDLPPEVLADLRRWTAEDANLEGLRAWLVDRGGWDKVDGDKVEAALLAAINRQEFSSCGTGRPPEPPFVLLYDTPRADRETPATLARIKTLMPKETPGKVLLGLDALRDALRRADWFILACLLPEHLDDRAGDWLGRLALPWMDERRADLEERLDRQAHAVPLVLQSRNLITAPSTGAAFLRFPSILKDAAAWCGALVPVDGDTIFADEPDLAAAPVRVLKAPEGDAVQLYKPRAWTVAAEHRLKGTRQPALPGLLVDPPHNPDLGAYLAVTATGAAVLDRLPGLCAKLLPLLFALCPLDGTAVAGPVLDLVKLLYPDWRTRRKMTPSKNDPGDVRRVGAAVAALLGLRIVEAVPGKGLRFYPVLHCDRFDAPRRAGDVPEVCLRMNPSLADLATPKKIGKADFVLVNLSRLMELDAKSPDRIAVALRLAAYWHMCKQRVAGGRRVFLPERLDFIPVDALLVESNAPGPVADVIAGADLGRAGRVKLSEARARLVDETLPALVKAGLLGAFDAHRPDRYAGRGAEAWQVKVPPPADYLEASRKTGNTRRPPPERRPRRK